MERLLLTLLDNAVKYTPAGTPIDISATARDGVVTVEVADRGPGIPAGEEMKIFDKFYRSSSATQASGVGLGLTISRGILTAHGGRITAQNRPGGGALFRFTLPITGSPPPAVPPAPGEQ